MVDIPFLIVNLVQRIGSFATSLSTAFTNRTDQVSMKFIRVTSRLLCHRKVITFIGLLLKVF